MAGAVVPIRNARPSNPLMVHEPMRPNPTLSSIPPRASTGRHAWLALATMILLTACGSGGDVGGSSDTAAGGGANPGGTSGGTPGGGAVGGGTVVTPPPPVGTVEQPAVSLAPAARLTGVAAVGRPLGQAAVALKCLGGTAAQTTTGSDGSFVVNVPEKAFPCLARARGAGSQRAEVYHSIAFAPGIMNITPVTDAVLALASEQVPSAFFDTATDSTIGAISQARLDADLTRLASALPATISLPQGRSPFTAAFQADGVDPMDKALDQIRAVLEAERMSWQQALDYVRAEAVITSDEPVFAGMTPLAGPPGAEVTLSGVNFPVSPVPPIRLLSSTGQGTSVTVSPGNTSTSLKFTVPLGMAGGSYRIEAGGFILPVNFFVAVRNPATFHPFYKSGPARQAIFNSALAGNARIPTGLAGFVIEYPGRRRTGETCRMRVNDDNSVSELDSDSKEVRRYEWEDRTQDFTGDAPTLYASNAWGGPDTNHAVKVGRAGAGIGGTSFMFGRGRFTDHFRLCVWDRVDAQSLQFAAGPALDNWRKIEGTHQGRGVLVGRHERSSVTIDGQEYVTTGLQQKPLPTTVRSLNLEITRDTTCSIRVAFSGAVTFLVGATEVGTFGVSDRFRYLPAVKRSDFDTSEIYLPLEFPAANNLRLLTAKPYQFPAEPKMVLEYGLPMQTGAGITRFYVTLYHGVRGYGQTPGTFQYDGTLSCYFPNLLPNWNHVPTTNVN
jgi:hypothetical protein